MSDTRYAIRYDDNDQFGRGGAVVGDFDTREEAEQVCRLLLSPAKVVERDE